MKTVVIKNFDPQVDAYLDRAPAFALPIMMHLRALVHKGCPEIEEGIKWSRPFFLYRGVILCNMSAFKQHCSFGFWGEEIGAVLREAKVLQEGGMGSLGRITSVQDLPSSNLMLQWIRQAAAFVDNGQYTSPIAARHKVVKARGPELATPSAFTIALQNNTEAAAAFAELNRSCKREYIEWISGAKRPQTRDRRIATAIEWITEGKPLNWKYQSC